MIFQSQAWTSQLTWPERHLYSPDAVYRAAGAAFNTVTVVEFSCGPVNLSKLPEAMQHLSASEVRQPCSSSILSFTFSIPNTWSHTWPSNVALSRSESEWLIEEDAMSNLSSPSKESFLSVNLNWIDLLHCIYESGFVETLRTMAFLQTLFFVTRQILRYVPSSRALLVLLTLTTTTTLFLSHYPKLVPLTVTRYLNKIRGKPEIDWYTTRFLDERLPIRPKPQVVKWNIVACAMVHNEAAYLAEWIEFHRLQGVDHFVLYDYRSTDLLVYYPMFYEDVGQKDLIDIIPAKFVPREMRDEKNHKKDRRLNKHYAMIDCYMRHRNLTQWIVMMEVSQFLYTPAHNSTWNFVKDLQIEHRQNLSVIATSSMTYGPVPDITTTFDSWMTPNSRTGGVDFNYQPVNGTFDVFPLVTDANPRRASHQELDASFEPCHGDKVSKKMPHV